MAKQGSLSGQQVANKYQLGELLGSGGMGAVYKAQDTRLHRPVAVKVMSPAGPVGVSDLQHFTQLFQAEALRLASLKHGSIPHIYDHFEEAAHWFLVMEFIEGETLKDHLQQRGGRLPVDEVLKIGLQLADVLNYLHTRQPQPVIFRDLKPANVMIAPDGQVFLIDFGIARLFTPGKSQDTFVFLSPGYAAPEQHGTAQTTVRSDIYSLGATLHHLLSGTHPATSPFHFAPLFIQQPAQLASLIAHMVAFDPANRPASMAEVKDALQRIIDQTALPLTQNVLSSLPASTLPSTVDSQSFIPTSALPPTQIASSEKPGTTIETYRGRLPVILVTWSPDGKYIASRLMGGIVVTQIWEVGTGKLIADHTRNYINPIDTFIWSPDGKYIATISKSNEARILEVRDATTDKIMFKYEQYPLSVAWSPDGKYIAVVKHKAVNILETATGKCKFEYEEDNYGGNLLTWSPDGKYITSGIGPHWKVREVDTGNLKFEYFANLASSCITWSPDGKYFASTDTYHSIIGYQTHIYIYGKQIQVKRSLTIKDILDVYSLSLGRRTESILRREVKREKCMFGIVLHKT